MRAATTKFIPTSVSHLRAKSHTASVAPFPCDAAKYGRAQLRSHFLTSGRRILHHSRYNAGSRPIGLLPPVGLGEGK